MEDLTIALSLREPQFLYRTGALHIGDRILAINGESIEGKMVAEAMRILQQSPDSVTLKVSRIIEPMQSSYTTSRGTNF